MDWIEVTPSFMSAVASVAAAIAAVVSLRISKRSTSIAESTALAVHHNSASLEFVKVLNKLGSITEEFSGLISDLQTKWPSELQALDKYELGGSDPRPLRHVLYNGSEMLADYASQNPSWGGSGSRGILFVIRRGMGGLDENEYQKLLKRADGSYSSFEGVFGVPSKSSPITSALAFRWVCYQLIKRVKAEDWQKAWKDAWLENGWLFKYQIEYLKIKPVLLEAQESLEAEKAKLAHTTFPLSHNKALSAKYNEVLNALEHLIKDCDPELLEVYKDWRFSEELSQLVVCSMATVNFALRQVSAVGRTDY